MIKLAATGAAVPVAATAEAAVQVAAVGTVVPAVAIGKAGTKAAAIGAAGMPEVRAVIPVPMSTTGKTFRSDPGCRGH